MDNDDFFVNDIDNEEDDFKFTDFDIPEEDLEKVGDDLPSQGFLSWDEIIQESSYNMEAIQELINDTNILIKDNSSNEDINVNIDSIIDELSDLQDMLINYKQSLLS